MSTSSLVPPRLPEPPEQIDRQYMQDLLRAIELFMTQERQTTVSDDTEAFSWFMK